MRLSTVLVATTIIAGLVGLGFAVAPAQMGTLYGVQTDVMGLWMARFFGISLIGVAILAWMLRGIEDSHHQRAIATGFLVFEVLGALMSLWLLFSPQVTPMLWLSVALYGILAIGYALVLAGTRAAAPIAPSPR